jgi:glycerol-3-phosphate acyltransferase PlsY
MAFLSGLSAMEFLVSSVGAYLLGSIPFGLILTRLAGLGDVRKIGSGNIGATNVLRTGHKGLAAATLLLDALKGTAAVVAASSLIAPAAGLIAAAGAFVGHCWPVWLRFKGGKGVATYLGALAGVAWPAALAFALVWLAVAAVLRYSSAAGLAAILAGPLVLWFLGNPAAALVFVALAILSVAKHRDNISRLLAGKETRIGQKG